MRLVLISGLLGGLLLAPGTAFVHATAPQAPAVRLSDQNDTVVDPFQASSNAKAIAFIFSSVTCPISNRYAPEVRRLHEAFTARGVAFWLVYPNPAESAEEIRTHLKEFGYPLRALRDPRHELVKLTQVVMTPEVGVYDQGRSLAYHGRIDDWYAGVGVQRPAPTRHDLRDALTALLSGHRPASSAQPAVGGCYIADFVQ